MGVHKDYRKCITPAMAPVPPTIPPKPLVNYIYQPFNKREFATSPSRDHDTFKQSGMIASDPLPSGQHTAIGQSIPLYNLHRLSDNISVTAGSTVYSTDGLCPAHPSANNNLFGLTFGIEFACDTETLVRQYSTFEFASAYQLYRDMTYEHSHPANFPLLACGVPAHTSLSIMNLVHSTLCAIRDDSLEVLDTSDTTATLSASQAIVPAFLNEAIRT